MPEPPLSEPGEFERIAVAFARVLRGSGVDVAVGRAVTYARALALTGVDRSSAVYWAGRTTLLGPPGGHLRLRPGLRRLLAAALRGHRRPQRARRADDRPRHRRRGRRRAGDRRVGRARGAEARRPVEPPGSVAQQGFRRLHPRRVRGSPPADERPPPPRRDAPLPSSAAVSQGGRAPRPPAHRAAIAAVGRRADPAGVHRGGGAAPADRADLRRVGVDGAVLPGAGALRSTPPSSAAARVEAFALGTRLTRMTRELSSAIPTPPWPGRPGRCQTGVAVLGWARGCGPSTTSGACGAWPGGGGGHPVRRVGPGRSGPARRADARLQRVAYRMVWVNPLKASPGYAPLAAGMAAALPTLTSSSRGTRWPPSRSSPR